jgi:transcriptional regulator with XRE-family HTH domain
MNINIAENLRRLRRQREITQEDLANFLGVSFQAVSKWERNEGYPDITILPAIANFFDVTLDELVGINEIKNQTRLDGINEVIKKNFAEGKMDEQVALLRETIKQFPNNFKLLHELATALCQTNDRKNIEEAIEISERILKHCTDNEIRGNTQGFLCHYYYRNGQNEKAISSANSLPTLWNCKEIVLLNFLTGEERVEKAQECIGHLAHALSFGISMLADAGYRVKTNLSVQERIEILEKSNQIFSLIYDKGDYLFFHIRIAENYRDMSALYLLDENYEQAIMCLEKAAEHTIAFDTLPIKENHTSLLVNRMVYNKYDTASNTPHNSSYIILNVFLSQDKYDVIRDELRFKAITEKLNKYAK